MQMRIALALAVLGMGIGSMAFAQHMQNGSHEEMFDRVRAEQKNQEMDSSGADALAAARRDRQLGELCESSGMYPQAEAALRRAIHLYPANAASERLVARNDLATLLAIMGEEKQAEQEDRTVLAEAEKIGDAGAASLAWANLADIEALQKHFARAVGYSRRALQLNLDATSTPAIDRLLAEQALGFALAGDRQCEEAITVLKEVVSLSKSSYGSQSAEAGINQFVLGGAAGRCGDSADAAAWMQQGILRMKATMGTGHPGYLHAMSEYAEFLRENGRQEEADAAEREVRMANATVDVRAMMPVTASLR